MAAYQEQKTQRHDSGITDANHCQIKPFKPKNLLRKRIARAQTHFIKKLNESEKKRKGIEKSKSVESLKLQELAINTSLL